MYTDDQDNFYLVYLFVCWRLGLDGQNRDEVEREGKDGKMTCCYFICSVIFRLLFGVLFG